MPAQSQSHNTNCVLCFTFTYKKKKKKKLLRRSVTYRQTANTTLANFNFPFLFLPQISNQNKQKQKQKRIHSFLNTNKHTLIQTTLSFSLSLLQSLSWIDQFKCRSRSRRSSRRRIQFPDSTNQTRPDPKWIRFPALLHS